VAIRLPQPIFALVRDRFGGSPRSVPHSLRLTPKEAHAMANRAFAPEPYDGDLVLFRAAENRAGRHDGWAELVKGKLEVHELPGGHTDILSEPRVRVLARELGAVLTAKQALYGCEATAETLKVVELPPRREQARPMPAAEMAISADGTTVGH
jgi:hypothetical protein